MVERNAPELMEKRSRMNAPCHQNCGAGKKNSDEYESRNEAALIYTVRARRNHQGNHNDVEDEAPGKPRLSKRSDHKDQNHKRDGDQSEAKIARPKSLTLKCVNGTAPPA